MQKENEFPSQPSWEERLGPNWKPKFSTLLTLLEWSTPMNRALLTGVNESQEPSAMTATERLFLNRAVTSLMSFWEKLLSLRLKGGSQQEIGNSLLEFERLIQDLRYEWFSTETINYQAEAKPSTQIGAEQTKSNAALEDSYQKIG